jgi:Tol biopolymer transport system component
LRWIAEGGSMVGVAAPVSHRRKHREWLAWSVAALALIAVGALVIPYVRKTPADIHAVRFWIPPKSGTTFGPENSGIRPFPAISPDGTRIVFQAHEPNEPTLLWVRSLDSLEAVPLPGTEMGGPAMPFWSPDSRYIGFTANGKLMKVEATGGPVQVICDVRASAEATWNRDGVILFANGPGTGAGPNEGLLRVSDAGGKPISVTTLDKERKESNHRAPYFLPDGRHFLFLAQAPNVIYAGSLDSTEPPVRLFASDSRAVYAAPGYLLFVQQGRLMGQRFDPTALKLSGDPFLVAENTRVNTGNGRAAFGVSDNGTLVYRTGITYMGDGTRVVWFDRSGKPTDTINQVQDNRVPRLSPDEKRLVVERRATIGCPDCSDLWVIDLMRGTNTRVTLGKGDSSLGAWSPDGTRILYRANSGGSYALYTKLSTGVAAEELLLKFDQEIAGAADWSQDDRYILFTVSDPVTGGDIWLLPLFGDRKPKAFVKTQFGEANPRFSFDGKWVAYTSNESGTNQVYVQPFPSGGPRVQISVNGGTSPRWRRDGKELFFIGPPGVLMAVDIKGTSSTIEPGVPKRLFQPPNGFNSNFAVTDDGSRFLLAVPQNTINNLTTVDDAPLTVILNWTASLKK